MKRSCYNCKANEGSRCSLGFETKKIHVPILYGLDVIEKPLEPCPKPMTIMQLIKFEDSEEYQKIRRQQLERWLKQ
jgi:hypothetical protein